MSKHKVHSLAGDLAGLYRVILADPPWSYRNGGNGAAKNHYPTMTTAGICALQVAGRAVGELAAPDCVLLLWGTWPLVPDALRVMEAWGFAYVSGFPWVKLQDPPLVELFDAGQAKPTYGTGFWVRGCSEYVFIGRRGQPQRPAGAFLGLLSERFPHSRKPENIYQYAEAMAGPYLELFARRRRPGWVSWGNELADHTTPGTENLSQLPDPTL